MISNKAILTAYLIRTLNVCFSKTQCSRDCEYHDWPITCGVIIWRNWYIADRFGPICERFDKITCHSPDASSWTCGASCTIQQKFECRLTILRKMLFKNRQMKPK